jgi:hypothetical protein
MTEDSFDPSSEDDIMVMQVVDEELVLPVWEPTGEARVDGALALLETLDPDDVHQHAQVYHDIHGRLREALTDVDTSAP